MKFIAELQTDGNGYWTGVVRNVTTTELELDYHTDEDDGSQYGELRVYFDTGTWNVKELGLIYTDHKFSEMLKVALFAAGLTGEGVEYSEQGMQGKDYVSLDVDDVFINVWKEKESAHA